VGIRASLIRQRQDQLPANLGHQSLMACRSILFRILQPAEEEGAITANPLRRMSPPKRRADPETVSGQAKRPAPAPPTRPASCWPVAAVLVEPRADRLAPACASVSWPGGSADGSSSTWPSPVLQVVDVRCQAGRFGSGFKPRPRSDAGFREVPLALGGRGDWPPTPARRRPRPAGVHRAGRRQRRTHGTRTILSRRGFRRLYQSAARRAGADLEHLQLRGPHDLRHVFSTWLEDAAYRHG
jgi:hypothetical protein